MIESHSTATSRRLIHSTGEMGDLIRSKDWSVTPVGARAEWSVELTAFVNAMLCSPNPMLIYWGPASTLLYNDAAIPIASTKHPVSLGLSAQEVWKEAWHIIGPEVKKTFETGQSTHHESVLVPLLKDGTLQNLWWDYSYSPLFEAGSISGVLVIFQDVTFSANVRRELETTAARLNQVLEATTDSVISIDRHWCILYMNPSAIKAAGSIGKATGRDFWEAFPATIYEGSPYVEHYYRAMNDRVHGEFEAFYPDPLNIWVRVQARPTAEGIVLFFRDVTEQKKATTALIQNEKLAAVGRLAASIAHEINNPLEAVTNLLYLARQDAQTAEMQEYLDTADRELRRASAITNQTLRFHRQSTKAIETSCQELIDSVITIYQGRIVNSRVKVEKRKRAERPVLCFDGEIRQVLNNLVGNAIDAMHLEGGRLILRSRESKDWKSGQNGLAITVADTGPGMSLATLARAFEPFFTTKGIGGTGLGLWISREIMNRHHGFLTVRSSQAGRCTGTVFKLFLPYDAAIH